MGRGSGREMRRLMVAVSASVLVLLLAIIAYFMADIIISTNANIEHNKERMIQESVRNLTEMAESMDMTSIKPAVMELFNPELIQRMLRGEMEALYNYCLQIVMMFYPIDYAGIIVDGKLAKYEADEGIAIDPSAMQATPPQEDYQTLDGLGNREGFFVSVFVPIDLSIFGMNEFNVNMVIDRTQELADIESYFRDQRNDLITRLAIASAIAILLSLLLTTIGLRYFTRKYVVKPIEELNHAAEKISDGTYEGEVKVDESSAFAALQGLLRSGQMVLSKMDDEIGE